MPVTLAATASRPTSAPTDSATPSVGARPSSSGGLSFEQVYAEHAGFVFRVLRGMGVPDGYVDDAVQDVFLVVHRRLHEFDGRARITTWLFRIAVNTGLNHRRRVRRARDHTPLREAHGGQLSSAEAGIEAREVERVLDALDDAKRLTLVLADMEQRSAPEIAELTGVPLNTVYSRLRRARSAFARLWKAKHGDLR